MVYGTWITYYYIAQPFVQGSVWIITCSFFGDLSFFHHLHFTLLTSLTHLVYQRLHFLQGCGFLRLLEMFASWNFRGGNASTKIVPFSMSLAACLAAFLLLLVSFLVYGWGLWLVFWLFLLSPIFLMLLLLFFVNCVNENQVRNHASYSQS